MPLHSAVQLHDTLSRMARHLPAPAPLQGGSGSASFGLGDAAGKPGSAGFACSPWHRPAAAKAQPVAVGVAGAAPAAGARAAGAAAAAERGGLASLQARLKELGLAGVMAYGEPC